MKNSRHIDENLFMSSSGTIADAMKHMTENKHGAVIVTDENHIVCGIVSDGDVRRAILKGATTLTPILKLVNVNISVVHDASDTLTEGKKIFEEHREFNLIPVVAADNSLVDVMVREELHA